MDVIHLLQWRINIKDKGIDDGNIAPRTDNWNIVINENGLHNNLLKQQTEMDENIIKQSDEIYSWHNNVMFIKMRLQFGVQ